MKKCTRLVINKNSWQNARSTKYKRKSFSLPGVEDPDWTMLTHSEFNTARYS